MTRDLIKIYILFLFTLDAFSAVSSVIRDGGNYDISFECRDTKRVVDDLNKFVLKTNSENNCSYTDVVADNEGKCRLSLNKCLPQYLSEKLGKTFPVPGPNCYGTSLYTTQNYKYARFVSVDEFEAIIDSPYCESKDRPGTGIIGYFSNKLSSIHAFTYISDSLTFERNGFDFNDEVYPFIANLVSTTRYKWEADDYCRRFSAGSSECYNKLKYVNCDLAPFFDGLPRDIYKKIMEVERDVNLLIKNENKHIKIAIINVKNDIEILKSTLQSLKSDDQEIVTEMLNSLSEQIKSVIRFHQ